MAAKAVPRLIAVVVLPTPPFWLAIASTRGRAASARAAGLAEGDDLRVGGWVGFRDIAHGRRFHRLFGSPAGAILGGEESILTGELWGF